MIKPADIERLAKSMLGRIRGLEVHLKQSDVDDTIFVQAWRVDEKTNGYAKLGETAMDADLLKRAKTNAALLVDPLSEWASTVRAKLTADGHEKLASATQAFDKARDEWRDCKRRTDRSYE